MSNNMRKIIFSDKIQLKELANNGFSGNENPFEGRDKCAALCTTLCGSLKCNGLCSNVPSREIAPITKKPEILVSNRLG